MKLRDYVGLSKRRQHQASWAMQLLLVGILFIGIDRGSATVVVNALVAIGVAQLPPLLQRNYEIAMDPALTLWVTAAAFFHALGVVGPPGGGTGTFYGSIYWWDHFTHALSASVVTAAGYATLRALDRHSDAIVLPARFMFVFLLIFIMAFGVAWEVLEFGLGEAARYVGNRSLLTQYGLEDSMMDLVFDLIGAILVAVWGTAYLSDFSQQIERVFGTR